MKATFLWSRGRPILYGIITIALLNFAGGPARAATQIWSGNGADSNWTTTANWTGGAAPSSGDSLIFSGTSGLTPNNNFAANIAITQITFSNTAGSFTLNGTGVGIGPNIVDQSILLQTINMALSMGSSLAVNVVAGGTLVINGVISDSALTAGSLNKIGGGLLVLANTETYTGNTTVSAGTLFVNGKLAASSSVTVLPGATLGGLGTILGNIAIQNGGTLAPGNNSVGTLAASNSVTLSGTALMELDRSATPNSDRFVGSASLSFGGSLVVSNVGSALQAGDCFTLFSAAKFNGSFATVNLPQLASGLAWDASRLYVDGTICVSSLRDSPGCCQNKFWHLADVQAPPARFGHAMAYDSARGRVVMFGGSGAGAALGDTWEWNGSSWSLMATSGPSARAFHAMAYDSRIGRVVMFGGSNGGAGGPLADTWLWDGITWTPVSGNGPGGRAAHAMAFDSSRGKTVLMGGASSTGELADSWEFDGANWSPVPASAGTPGPRQGHVMAYDSVLGKTVLFGGLKQPSTLFGDTWTYDGNTWSIANTTGPSPRAFAAMVYNDNCDSVVLNGGGPSLNTPLSDTWEWNGTTWTLSISNIPPSRLEHAMAHDSGHHQTVLFGGSRSTQGTLNDTWLFYPTQTPPALVSVYGACGDQKIIVAFNVPVTPASAQNPANYNISCGPVGVGIVKAVLTADARMVCLFLDQPLGANGSCFIFINGVQDLCGNRISAQQGFDCRPEPCVRGAPGTEFWLAFPGNYAPDPTNQPLVQLFIAGAPGTIGAASMPLLPTPFSSSFTIPAGGVATVTLPRDADLGDLNDAVNSNGVHVIASQPVSVYGYNHIKFTTDAYLGLSTRAIGKTYLVSAYQNVFTNVPELNGSQLAIAASVDNTTVFIVPSYAVGSHPAGVPFNLTLMQGQTYQLRNTNPIPADVTGTIVVSDQPISVFGSHQCANIPNSNTFFCDYIVEQMPPTELWGNNFFTVPLAGRTPGFGDTFHIMALFNGTSVSVNGAVIPGSLNQGKFYELQLVNASQITSTKPVLVSQFADSSDYDGTANSDPFMVVIPATPLYASSYTVQTPTTDFINNYINIVAPAAAIGQINLDGAALPAVAFTPIGATGYSSAQRPVGVGPHILFSSNSQPFGIVVYGWNLYDAYGYPGATCGSVQGQPPRFTCPPTNVTVQAGAGCVGAVPDLTTQVGNGGQALYITQNPAAGTLLSPATYPITVTIVDHLGGRQICTSLLTVTTPQGSGLICPQNISTNCASAAGRVVNFVATACNAAFTVSCSPPSGSLFPPGTTTVTCTATNSAGTIDKCTFTVTVNCLVLSISQTTKTNMTVTWQGSGTLQKATNATGPWISIPGVSNTFTTPFTGSRGFFRVLQ